MISVERRRHNKKFMFDHLNTLQQEIYMLNYVK